jgi:hypothetical protein
MRIEEKGQFTTHYDKYLQYRLEAIKNLVTYDLHEIRLPWWRSKEVQSGVHTLTTVYDKDMGNPLKPVGVEEYDYYPKNGFEYAVVHSDRYSSFLKADSTNTKRYPSFSQFYKDLFEKGTIIKEFDNENGKRPGPVVKILRFE